MSDGEVPKPAWARDRLNKIVADHVNLLWTKRVKAQLHQKDLVMGDLHYLLRFGTIPQPGEKASRDGYFKYVIEWRTPNCIDKVVRARIIIPRTGNSIKVQELLD